MFDPVDSASQRRYRGETSAERKAARHAKIVDAGFKAFGTHGYRGTTVRQVCAEAGLTERYFYESFENKDELFRAVYELVMRRVGDAVQPALAAAADTAEAKARALLGAYFGTIEGDPELGRILLIEVLNTELDQHAIYRDAMSVFTDFVLNEARVLLPRQTDNRAQEEVVAAGIVGAIVHVAMRWVISDFERPREEVIAGLLHLLLAASR